MVRFNKLWNDNLKPLNQRINRTGLDSQAIDFITGGYPNMGFIVPFGIDLKWFHRFTKARY